MSGRGPRVIAIPRHEEYAERGFAFVATTGKKTLSGGADFMYFLVGSGKRCRIKRIIFAFTAGVGTLYIGHTVTGTITGTDLTISNKYVGKGQTSTATVKSDVGGVTGKTAIFTIPFTATGTSIIMLDLEYSLILEAGKSLLLNLDKDATSADLAATIEWAEEDA